MRTFILLGLVYLGRCIGEAVLSDTALTVWGVVLIIGLVMDITDFVLNIQSRLKKNT